MNDAGVTHSYAHARQRFLAAATRSGARLHSAPLPNFAGPDGEPLAIDVAAAGSPNAETVFVVVSGTRGLEGFAGSALQTHWLQSRSAAMPPSTRVVLVHGLNPFGFAWDRRTNEDNVDVQRNLFDWSTLPPPNASYASLASLLVPVDWSASTRSTSTGKLLGLASEMGLRKFAHAVAAGQCDYPHGLAYRGAGPAWSHRWLQENAATLCGTASRVAVLDVHTGPGPWGVGRLTNTTTSAPSLAAVSAARPLTMRLDASAGRTWQVEGVGTRLTQLLPATEVSASTLRFGTTDAFNALQAMRTEAWANANSSPTSTDSQRARATMRSAFTVEDPAWLSSVISQFDSVVAETLEALR